MMQRFSMCVSGRVQGVGFRYFALEAARFLGVTGWVRNHPNGNVIMEVQGDESSLAQFFKIVQEGPRTSHVSEIVKSPLPLVEDEKTFLIRR